MPPWIRAGSVGENRAAAAAEVDGLEHGKTECGQYIGGVQRVTYRPVVRPVVAATTAIRSTPPTRMMSSAAHGKGRCFQLSRTESQQGKDERTQGHTQNCPACSVLGDSTAERRQNQNIGSVFYNLPKREFEHQLAHTPHLTTSSRHAPTEPTQHR